MKPTSHVAALGSLLALAAAADAQAARQLSSQILTFPPADEAGHDVASVGDWNGDGIPDYAVGLPGVLGGLVYVHSGANGWIFRVVQAVPEQPACGSPIVGPWLGSALEALPDVDLDGQPELLIGRRHAGRLQGGCWDATYGGFTIAFSSQSTYVYEYVSPQSGVHLGTDVAYVGSSGGTHYFAVGGERYYEVWAIAPGFQLGHVSFTGPTPEFGSTVSAAGRFGSPNLTYAVRTARDRVTIYEVGGASPLVPYFGPVNSNFGASIVLLDETAGGKTSLAIGAPDANGGNGAVYVRDDAGGSSAFVGTAGNRLGRTLAVGGDVDGDGSPDFVAGGDLEVLVSDVGGTPKARPILPDPQMTGFATSLAILPDITGDGYDDVLMGADGSYVYLGGPDASVTTVGQSCSPSGALPVLSLSAPPVIGTPVTLAVTGAAPSAPLELHAGPVDPAGVPVGPCLWHLPVPPQSVVPGQTDGSGGWTSGPTSVGAVVGAQLGFQSVIVGPANELQLSNAVELLVGW